MRSSKIKTCFFLVAFIGFSVFVSGCSSQDSSQDPKSAYVGKSTSSKYLTIQSAIDALSKRGGGLVKVEPGIYNENLTLRDGVDLWGEVGVADTKTCVIHGTHLPPASGTLTIRNIFLSSDSDVLSSDEPGDSVLILIDCAVSVKDGYTFNLPHWKGALVGFDLGEIGSENNGGIYNLGGSKVFITNLTMGSGDRRPMVLSGPTEIFGCVIKSPVEFHKESSSLIGGASLFQNPLSIFDSSKVESYGSVVVSKDKTGIINHSQSRSLFARTTVNSTSGLPVQDTTQTLDILDPLFNNMRNKPSS